MASTPNGQIVDEFENSFQACLAALTNQDYFSIRDSEEIKTGVEQTIQRFLDLAKQMECFFLQKRLLLSVQKPEQIILEDINDLRSELSRKEQQLQKYYEKIGYWQSLLSDISGSPRPVPPQNPVIPPQTPQHAQQVSPMVPHHHLGPPSMGPHHLPPPPPQVGQPGGGGNLGPPLPPPQMQGPPPLQGGPMGMIPGPQLQHMGPQHTQGGLQGPLAYLERTTSNIGMPEPPRR